MGFLTNEIKCPRCGEAIKRNKSVTGQLTGAPFCPCPNCGRLFYDESVEEPAIAAFKEKEKSFNYAKLIYAVIPTVGAVVYLRAYMHGVNSSGLIPGIIFAALAVFFIVLLVLEIIKYLRRSSAEKRIIDHFEGRSGTLSKDLAESLDRLSSKSYVEALEAYGADVPDYFRKRAEKLDVEKTE